jgi:HCOMODA/2-hydroxy-3-carboxy-muconic semialdehyde decarboxylase
MLITPAVALARVDARDLVTVALDATALPPGAPAEAWAHLRTYAARPDAKAIARAQPPDAFAVSAVIRELRPLHGQACWLGHRVPVHDDARLLRSAELADAAVATLGDADALLLRGNGGLTLGTDPGLAVVRMWLLAAACRTYLAATCSGEPWPLSDIEIDSWRAVQGELLPRLWRHLAEGDRP